MSKTETRVQTVKIGKKHVDKIINIETFNINKNVKVKLYTGTSVSETIKSIHPKDTSKYIVEFIVFNKNIALYSNTLKSINTLLNKKLPKKYKKGNKKKK